MRAAEELEVPLLLPEAPGTPVRARVVMALRTAVGTGHFPPGARLPGSRTLAAHLGVSRSTVVEALGELEGEGWVESRHGSGTYATADVGLARAADGREVAGAARRAARPRAQIASSTPTPRAVPTARGGAAQGGRLVDLVPCLPETSTVVDAAWRSAWRAAASAPVEPLGLDPRGEEPLRRALADHARRTRGLACRAEDLVITAGTTDALRLVADALGVRGSTAALEEPGYFAARDVLRLAGARLHPVPVDDDGLLPDALEAAPPDTRVLYVTPSHQFPLGGRLPVARRLAVLRWARERGAVVLEDDYDGEFRYGASPLPALATLDRHGDVVYLGTLSKLVGPGMRLGYAVAHPDVVEDMVAVRRVTGVPVTDVVQRAMATYVADGGLRRHVARQRRLFAERRRRLTARLGPLPGVAKVTGLSAGLHVVLELAEDRDAEAVAIAALQRGVRVRTLDDFAAETAPAEPAGAATAAEPAGAAEPADRGAPVRGPALLLGYGTVPAADLGRALDVLADVLA